MCRGIFCLKISVSTLILYALLIFASLTLECIRMASQSPQTPHKSSPWRELAPFMNIGLELAATVGAFGLIGWFIDKYAETAPRWFVALLVVGVIVGMTKMLQTVLKASGKAANKKKDSSTT
jgi:F0F1-type ATP synthase assembly protein I